jgi:hypothetical protein
MPKIVEDSFDEEDDLYVNQVRTTDHTSHCLFSTSRGCCGLSELYNFRGEGKNLAAAIKAAITSPNIQSGIFATTVPDYQEDVETYLKQLGFTCVGTFKNKNSYNKVNFWFKEKDSV